MENREVIKNSARPEDFHHTASLHSIMTWTASPLALNTTQPPMTINSNITKTVTSYIAFITGLFGLVGNVVIIFVMKRKALQKNARSLLVTALAIVDIFYFICPWFLTLPWIWFEFDVYSYSSVTCKLAEFASWFLAHLDAWVVTSLAIDRIIAVFKPLELQSIVTKARVYIVLLTIFCLFFIWDIEIIYRFDIVSINNVTGCMSVNEYPFSETKDLLSEFLATFLPMIIVVILNTALMVKMHQVRNKRVELHASMTQAILLKVQEAHKMNLMIIIATMSFVILVSPISIYYILTNFDAITVDPIREVLYLFALLYPSCNFPIYFISGRTFRMETLNLFRELRQFCKRNTIDFCFFLEEFP